MGKGKQEKEKEKEKGRRKGEKKNETKERSKEGEELVAVRLPLSLNAVAGPSRRARPSACSLPWR
jgi:hypothetical protein